jgi:hypothetical protein
MLFFLVHGALHFITFFLFSQHAGCAALAIKEKEEKKSPSLDPCKRKREKKLFLSHTHTFQHIPYLLDRFSNRKTTKKGLFSVGI